MTDAIDGFSFCRHGNIDVVCLVCVRETHEEINTLRVKLVEMVKENANLKLRLAARLFGSA